MNAQNHTAETTSLEHSQPIPFTINIPSSDMDKLVRLSAIANRSVEWLILDLIHWNTEQNHDERDLDSLVCCIAYDSKEEAEGVARAASAFQGRKYVASGCGEGENRFCVKPVPMGRTIIEVPG